MKINFTISFTASKSMSVVTQKETTDVDLYNFAKDLLTNMKIEKNGWSVDELEVIRD